MFVTILLISLGYVNGQFPDSEYCSIVCDTGQHTMCLYEPVSRNCHHVQSLMDSRRRQKILSLHNSFRNVVAGGTHPFQRTQSSNMRQLYWDLELEGIAERWASQCNVSSNDDCRDVARFKVGQVMSKSRALTLSLDYYDTLFNMVWFAEVENLSKCCAKAKYMQQRSIKHVAQILYADTMRIGCADVIIKKARDFKPTRVTICNYGPEVVNGVDLFKIGEPCKSCPVGTMCRGPYSKYPHLCSEYRQYDIPEEKPNPTGIQINHGNGDLAAPSIDREAEERHDRHRSGYNRKKSHSNEDIGKTDGRESKRRKQMNRDSLHPDFDDGTNDYSDYRQRNEEIFINDNDNSQEHDYVDPGNNHILLGGRGLDAGRDLNESSSNQANDLEVSNAPSAIDWADKPRGPFGDDALGNGTDPSGNGTDPSSGNETRLAPISPTHKSSSPVSIHSTQWTPATLFITLVAITSGGTT